MIPKNIFMIWTSENRCGNIMIPDFVRMSYQAFKQANPSYEVVLLGNDSDIAKECKDIVGNLKFESPCNMFNELLRLYAVYAYGGIYVDADCFPVKPFDDNVIRQYDVIMPKGDYFAIASKKRSVDEFIGCSRYLEMRRNSSERFGTFHVPYVSCNGRQDGRYGNEIWYRKGLELKDKFLTCQLKYGEHIGNIDNPMYFFDHYRINTWNSMFLKYAIERNIDDSGVVSRSHLETTRDCFSVIT